MEKRPAGPRSLRRRPAAIPFVPFFPLLLFAGPRETGAETLRVITIDAATSKPIPARVSVRPEGGEWISGRDAAGKSISSGGLPRLWSGGTIDVEVKAGKVEVIASRPFARLPASAEALVPAGGTTEVKLILKPVVDLPSLGWHGGDAHCHVVHGEKVYAMDLRHASAIARAEGLDWVAFGEVWTSLSERQPRPEEMARTCADLTDDLFLPAWIC